MVESSPVTLKRRLPPLWFPAKQPRLNDHYERVSHDPPTDGAYARLLNPPALSPLNPPTNLSALKAVSPRLSISHFFERFPPRPHSDLVQATIHPQTLALLRDKKCPSRPSTLAICSSCTREIDPGNQLSGSKCDSCAKLSCPPCLNSCLSCDRIVCGNCSYWKAPEVVHCADCQSWMST